MNGKIAVLGLGAMGLPMAKNLAKEFDLVGFDLNPQRLDMAEKEGIVTASSARKAAEGADFLLVAVRNKQQLDDLLYASDTGVASVLGAAATVILTSTVGIETAVAAGKELDSLGIGLVDAPVSGGPIRAGLGDLLVVVGAKPQVYRQAEPILQAMAGTLVFVGDEPGKGQAMKTVNQLLCGVHIAAAGEAMALAKKLGLDVEQALKAIQSGAGESFMLGDRGPRMLQAYTPTGAEVKSALDIFVKDMGIVTEAARNVGLAVPVAAAAQQLYLIGQAAGLGKCDDSAVIKVVDPQGE